MKFKAYQKAIVALLVPLLFQGLKYLGVSVEEAEVRAALDGLSLLATPLAVWFFKNHIAAAVACVALLPAMGSTGCVVARMSVEDPVEAGVTVGDVEREQQDRSTWVVGIGVTKMTADLPAAEGETPGKLTADSLGFSEVFGEVWKAGTGTVTVLAQTLLTFFGHALPVP